MRLRLAAAGIGLATLGFLLWANWPAAPVASDARADFLIVEKHSRRLLVYSHGVLIREYHLSLGREPVGPKRREGDERTPEGLYRIDHHNPNSRFHRALHVSYPSPADILRARRSDAALGGEIMVHGIQNGLGWLGRAHRFVDWTTGCIALPDPEIEELYRIVPDGTSIEIRP